MSRHTDANANADADADANADKKKNTKKKTIPNDFLLTNELIKYAKAKGVTSLITLNSFTEGFVLACQSKDYKYADFSATWKNWLRKAIDEGKIQKDPVYASENY